MATLGGERIAIYIDGGNFYRLLKASGLPKEFHLNYIQFADFLARTRRLISKRYYIGTVRNHDGSVKGDKLVRSQQKFLAGLESDGFTIKRGRIVYDHQIREKGIDVKIAVDLVVGAMEDIYDTAIVVSSDTDLIPAIRYVQHRGKKVEYVGFSYQPSVGMTKEADLSVLLLSDQLLPFDDMRTLPLASEQPE